MQLEIGGEGFLDIFILCAVVLSSVTLARVAASKRTFGGLGSGGWS